jgi:DNA replication initiation complex subunit (GINS family)
MLETIDLSGIQDENARQLIGRLLNLIEELSADLRDAQAEMQRLRDEINRLKGEQGKPSIKANKAKPVRSDHSSEQERRKPMTLPRFGGQGVKQVPPADKRAAHRPPG